MQRERRGGMGLASPSQSRVLAKMDRRTLEAEKDFFDRDRRVADREKSVIERRLQPFGTRKKLFENRVEARGATRQAPTRKAEGAWGRPLFRGTSGNRS